MGFKPNSFKGWNGTFFIYSFFWVFFQNPPFSLEKKYMNKQHKTLEDWKIPIFCRTVGDTSSFMVQFCSQLCWFSGVFLSETTEKSLTLEVEVPEIEICEVIRQVAGAWEGWLGVLFKCYKKNT